MSKYKNIIYPSFLLIVVFIVFYPILGNDFLYQWDDQWVVINSYTEGGFNLKNLWAILSEYYHGQYAPLNELLYLILHSLFGYNSFFFHFASLLIHAINSILVYYCIILLLEMNAKVNPEYHKSIAILTALIFAIHPFNVESVAWMSASKIIVYAFYYLIATYFFMLYIQKNKIKDLIITGVFFIFSFLGKEQAVTFPIWMILLYCISGYSIKDKKIWLTTLPFIGLSLLGGVITILSQEHFGIGVISTESYHLWQRIVYACYSFYEYLIKCLFPIKLSFLYPFPAAIGQPLPMWLLVYPFLIIIPIIGFYKYFLSNKALTFCLIFFFIHIAIALHIIPLSRYAIVADRYAYIASIGVCFYLSYLSIHLIKKFDTKGKTISIIIFCSYILFFGISSNSRCRVWHNSDTLKKEINELLELPSNTDIDL